MTANENIEFQDCQAHSDPVEGLSHPGEHMSCLGHTPVHGGRCGPRGSSKNWTLKPCSRRKVANLSGRYGEEGDPLLFQNRKRQPLAICLGERERRLGWGGGDGGEKKNKKKR